MIKKAEVLCSSYALLIYEHSVTQLTSQAVISATNQIRERECIPSEQIILLLGCSSQFILILYLIYMWEQSRELLLEYMHSKSLFEYSTTCTSYYIILTCTLLHGSVHSRYSQNVLQMYSYIKQQKKCISFEIH